jgi:hypothetical protein
MTYQITGSNSAAAIGHQRETLEEAREVARDLIKRGFRNVKIKDSQGNEVE